MAQTCKRRMREWRKEETAAKLQRKMRSDERSLRRYNTSKARRMTVGALSILAALMLSMILTLLLPLWSPTPSIPRPTEARQASR